MDEFLKIIFACHTEILQGLPSGWQQYSHINVESLKVVLNLRWSLMKDNKCNLWRPFRKNIPNCVYYLHFSKLYQGVHIHYTCIATNNLNQSWPSWLVHLRNIRPQLGNRIHHFNGKNLIQNPILEGHPIISDLSSITMVKLIVHVSDVSHNSKYLTESQGQIMNQFTSSLLCCFFCAESSAVSKLSRYAWPMSTL